MFVYRQISTELISHLNFFLKGGGGYLYDWTELILQKVKNSKTQVNCLHAIFFIS